MPDTDLLSTSVWSRPRRCRRAATRRGAFSTSSARRSSLGRGSSSAGKTRSRPPASSSPPRSPASRPHRPGRGFPRPGSLQRLPSPGRARRGRRGDLPGIPLRLSRLELRARRPAPEHSRVRRGGGFRKEEHGLPEFRLETGWVFSSSTSMPRPPPRRNAGGPAGAALLPRARGHAPRRAQGLDGRMQLEGLRGQLPRGVPHPDRPPSLMKELDYARYVTETRRCYSLQHSPIRENGPGRLKRSATRTRRSISGSIPT